MAVVNKKDSVISSYVLTDIDDCAGFITIINTNLVIIVMTII